MKETHKKKITSLYDHFSRANKSTIFVGSELVIFKVILLTSIVALAVLFLPFAKTAFLAIISAFAFMGAKDQIHKLSKYKVIIFYSSLGIASLTFIGVFVSMVKMIFSSMGSFSNPETFSKLKMKFLELYLPTFQILNKYFSKILNELDKSQSLETRLFEALNKMLEALISLILGWLTQFPINTLKFIFFIYIFAIAIRKIKSIDRSSKLSHSKEKTKTLIFFISVAKKSGFTSIVMMILTAFAQATFLTFGSIIAGITNWPIVFISTFIFSMIPVVGVLPVALATTIYAGSVFNFQKGLVMIFFGIGASLIDNILRPILITGKDTKISPIFCFFALIGSLFTFGFAGLFIGPFVLVFTTNVYNQFKENEMTGIKIK